MKYVIFKSNDANDPDSGNPYVIPVLLPEHATHADVSIRGYSAVAAGFVAIVPGIDYAEDETTGDYTSVAKMDVRITQAGSQSLGIASHRFDPIVIKNLISDEGMYAFNDDTGDQGYKLPNKPKKQMEKKTKAEIANALAEAIKSGTSYTLSTSDPTTDNIRLGNDIGMDSLDMVEMEMYVERNLGITMTDDQWLACFPRNTDDVTFGSIVEFLYNHINGTED